MRILHEDFFRHQEQADVDGRNDREVHKDVDFVHNRDCKWVMTFPWRHLTSRLTGLKASKKFTDFSPLSQAVFQTTGSLPRRLVVIPMLAPENQSVLYFQSLC